MKGLKIASFTFDRATMVRNRFVSRLQPAGELSAQV